MRTRSGIKFDVLRCPVIASIVCRREDFDQRFRSELSFPIEKALPPAVRRRPLEY
jgi:hypothetical protein